MKVGFAVQYDEGMESTVYDHFGSAPAFLIVDTEEKQIAKVDNSNSHESHGNCNPMGKLGGNNIDALVVGGIGAGAIMRLNSLGIKIYRAGAVKIRENIDLLNENRLLEITPNDSCGGHQGHCDH
ncbi:MAG: NifB/NifX family molybdenum-iron cluster-binding protein [Acidobacteria bacterium]|nr:NifB/NifX family molybdenum-iron cluster-binding protein [Acidobacteriota bacterium]